MDLTTNLVAGSKQTFTRKQYIEPTPKQNTFLTDAGWSIDNKPFSNDKGWTSKLAKGFCLYTRVRPLQNIIKCTRESVEISEISTKTKTDSVLREEILKPENGEITGQNGQNQAADQSENARGQIALWAERVAHSTSLTSKGELRISTRLSEFESLRSLESDTTSLVIGFDSEWYDEPRKMISWQFAVVWDEKLFEFVFVKRNYFSSDSSNDLFLELALGRIIDSLGCFERLRLQDITSYKYIESFTAKRSVELSTTKLSDATEKAKFYYIDGEPSKVSVSEHPDLSSKPEYSLYVKDYDIPCNKKYSVTLVGHNTLCDITAFNQGKKHFNIIKHLTSAQGGCFTTMPSSLKITSVMAPHSIYAVNLVIRDTMCYAPADKKKLSDLGTVVGVDKVVLPGDDCISHMDRLVKNNLPLYLEYAATDAVIALLYVSSIYGINREFPVTILASGTSLIKESLLDYFDISKTSKELFDITYRGLENESRGKRKIDNNSNRPSFLANKCLTPVSRDASILQNDAQNAYHGGYNGCSFPGFFDTDTYDYDLKNAYPTAMCLVPDVDWDDCFLNKYETGHVLSLEDFRDEGHDGCINPFRMIIAYVEFEFPDSVLFPCIPVNVDGSLIYPLSSKGLNGVYTVGPELFLALKLGCKIILKDGYVIRKRRTDDGEVSYSLRQAVLRFVSDRAIAKAKYGSGLENELLKLIVNGAYGKIAQNVIDKSHWSGYSNEMESIGCSSITNPVTAAFITSIVRAVLLAAQNQVAEKGYNSYSVTTDGFIADMPESMLRELNLYGFSEELKKARLFLTNGTSDAVWEIKHIQNDLINLTTRCNISLITGGSGKKAGVCAHGGVKSPFPSDSYEDRLWMAKSVLSRTGAVSYIDKVFPTLKDIALGKSYMVNELERGVRLDFDMKRKPVESSVNTCFPVIAGQQYEIACVSTIPYKTVAEYSCYREVKDGFNCIRTASDWNRFFDKIAIKMSGKENLKPRDMEFAKLFSVIMGYRSGKLSIPALDDILSVEDKCVWINRFNKSGKAFKPSDWKNARRPERQSNMLPLVLLADLHRQMTQA